MPAEKVELREATSHSSTCILFSIQARNQKTQKHNSV